MGLSDAKVTKSYDELQKKMAVEENEGSRELLYLQLVNNSIFQGFCICSANQGNSEVG